MGKTSQSLSHDVASYPDLLVEHGSSSQEAVICYDDVPPEKAAIGHCIGVSDHAVMTKMDPDHEKIIVAQCGQAS